MHILTNKQIILGVTGSIAAYKSAELIRLLRSVNAAVRVVMTDNAKQFITPMTLQALCGHPIHDNLMDPTAEAAMGHIELARWADLILIAPASANFIARLANGQGDDLLTTLCLATKAPILLAPAMNQAMWQDSATQANCDTLQKRDIQILGPDSGSQACGDVGPGRMLELNEILNITTAYFQNDKLAGQHVVITAGPTQEAIDPVRYMTNRSSGKMGYALATAAREAGANVTLITGPTKLAYPDKINVVEVVTAQQMHDAVMANLENCDIFIGAAAVADFRPETPAKQKIKKSHEPYTITLIPNPDIIKAVSEHQPKPFVVGFAAETNDLLNNAQSKLSAKNLDMIIANDVSKSDIGFDSNENAVTIISKSQTMQIEKTQKSRLATTIIKKVAQHIGNPTG